MEQEKQAENKVLQAKKYHKNPRKITRKDFEDLEKWLIELGALDCIVHNIRTNEILSGNQRTTIFGGDDKTYYTLETVYDKPDAQGTVAWGYIIFKNNRYPYRQVDWDEDKSERAVIIANRAGGEFDYDILRSRFEQEVLEEAGFAAQELKEVFAEVEADLMEEVPNEEKPEYPIVAEYSEKYDAILIVSTNAIDTNFLREILGLDQAQSYKSQDLGTTNVITAQEFAKRYQEWTSRS